MMEYKKIISVLQKYGVSVEDAQTVADCLCTADQYGVLSHGTAVLPSHLERIRRGGYNLKPNFKVIRETVSFSLIDGDNAMGPISATYCMNHAIKKAKEAGVYTVFSRNNNTFGPAFYYSLKAAEKGCIGFICSNSPAQMAPMGGLEKLLGTNPFAAVIPVPEEDPIIIDMATSVAAKSKFKEYKELGKNLPIGWALDKEGIPTTDPDQGINGLVLPMAGFKGYALSLLIDVISGVISGAAYLDKVGRFYSDDDSSMNVGFYITVIDPVVVCGEEYAKEIKAYAHRIKKSDPIEGQKVVLPGEDRLSYFKKMETFR
ncbi:MAG: Ldh family oxidoreductase [Clostridia bacterium]|nr:Ldh family oxidoreductase [Clostridia bacterium]